MNWISNTHHNHKNYREINFNVFKNILKNSEKCLLLDAFMMKRSINFINGLEKDNYSVITTKPKEINRKIHIIKKLSNLEGKIVDLLHKKKKLYIFYPFKNTIEIFASRLCAISNIDRNDILVYHADTDDDKKMNLANVTDEWKNKKMIITNSCITVGVNYDVPNDFDHIIMAYASCSSS